MGTKIPSPRAARARPAFDSADDLVSASLDAMDGDGAATRGATPVTNRAPYTFAPEDTSVDYEATFADVVAATPTEPQREIGEFTHIATFLVTAVGLRTTPNGDLVMTLSVPAQFKYAAMPASDHPGWVLAFNAYRPPHLTGIGDDPWTPFELPRGDQ